MSKIEVSDLSTPFTEKTGPKLVGRINTIRHAQAVAASLAAAYMWTAEFDGALSDASVTTGALCAAGESCTFDVLKNAVSVLTAVGTVDSTTTTKHITLALDPNKVSFVKGDVFTVTRVYTAGGGPTPMTNSTVIIEPSYRAVKK